MRTKHKHNETLQKLINKIKKQGGRLQTPTNFIEFKTPLTQNRNQKYF